MAAFTSTLFTPTDASIPPLGALLRFKQIQSASVNTHPLNPVEFLLRAAQIFPEKLAIVHSNKKHPVYYSFSVWAQRVQNLAYALIQAGVQLGDRVAVVAPNSPLIAGKHFHYARTHTLQYHMKMPILESLQPEQSLLRLIRD